MPRKKSETKQARFFGLFLTILLAALSAFSLYKDHPVRAAVLGAGSGSVLALTFLARPLWLKLFRLWMKFAEALSWVMTRVVLSVFYFIVLTPVGLVMRLLGKAPLDLAWQDGKATYWIDKSETAEATLERYGKQF